MKTKLFLILAVIALFGTPLFAQKVVITPKKVTYTRKKPITEYKKTFTITYPKVKAATKALSARIENTLSYQTVLGLNLKEEMGELQWLEEADFETGYNDNGILCITLSMNGSAAYPSGTSKVVVVDLKTGNRVKAADVFTNLPGLTAMVRKAQKKEIADSTAEIKKDPESKDIDTKELFGNAKFTVANLEGFSVDAKGVTFHYDYGFVHAIQALQPAGDFSYTWAQLKPYIKRGGLLGRFVR